MPILRISVALEEDLLVRADDPREDARQAREVTVVEPLELVRQLLERVRDGRVEDRLRPVDRGRRADGPELELVAGERERRGPVPVGRILRQDRQ